MESWLTIFSNNVFAETTLLHFQDGGGTVSFANPVGLSQGTMLQVQKQSHYPLPLQSQA